MNKNNNLIREITLRDTIYSLFRKKHIIIFTFIIVLFFTYIAIQFDTPVYQATVKMYIKGQSQVATNMYSPIGPFRIHFTQMEIVKSNPVLKRTVDSLKLHQLPLDYEKQFCSKAKKVYIDYKMKKTRLELDKLTPEQKKKYLLESAINSLKNRIITKIIPHTDIFSISVSDYDPEKAIEIANVISRSYTIFDQEQQLAELKLKYGDLHPSVMQLSDSIRTTIRKLNGKQLNVLDAIGGTASVKIIEQATSTGRPIGKPKSLMFVIGIIVALFLGTALAIAFDYMDQTFKSPEDIIAFLNLPFLGFIPKRKFKEKSLITNCSPNSGYYHAIEDLSNEIYTFMKTQNLKSLLIVSATSLSKDAVITQNLGLALSNEWSTKTLLIDANVENPSMHRIFNLENNNGLGEILENTGEADIQEINENLKMITAGKATQKTATLLSSTKIKELIDKEKDSNDAIIIDATRVKGIKDISVLSHYVDGVILVINHGKERRQVLKNAIIPLRNKKVKVVGAILNDRKFPIPKFIYNRF